MNTLRQRRLLFVIMLLISSSLVVFLVIKALQQNINLFYTPAQVVSQEAPKGKRIRVGGMVKRNSVHHQENLWVQFEVTDFAHTLIIRHQGVLPDLFREERGMVAVGHLDPNNVFLADEILAKHDENYMPPEVKESLQTSPGASGAPLP